LKDNDVRQKQAYRAINKVRQSKRQTFCTYFSGYGLFQRIKGKNVFTGNKTLFSQPLRRLIENHQKT